MSLMFLIHTAQGCSLTSHLWSCNWPNFTSVWCRSKKSNRTGKIPQTCKLTFLWSDFWVFRSSVSSGMFSPLSDSSERLHSVAKHFNSCFIWMMKAYFYASYCFPFWTGLWQLSKCFCPTAAVRLSVPSVDSAAAADLLLGHSGQRGEESNSNTDI